MLYAPANSDVVFFRPTDGSGTIAGDFIVEFSDAVPQVQGEVTAVHPENKKIRAGDYIFFREHAPRIVKCLGGKYYTIRTKDVHMLIRSDYE
jgi:hypothetical protein